MATVSPETPIDKPGPSTKERYLKFLFQVLKLTAARIQIKQKICADRGVNKNSIRACLDLGIIEPAEVDGCSYRWICEDIPNEDMGAAVYTRCCQIARGIPMEPSAEEDIALSAEEGRRLMLEVSRLSSRVKALEEFYRQQISEQLAG